MPKIKTHKGTAKRFKYSGRGKLLRSKGVNSHFRRRRSKRVKRMLDEMHEVTTRGDIKRIKRLVLYLKKSR